MMKKFVCLFSAVILLFAFCACQNTETSLIGTWEYDNNYELKELVSGQLDDSYFYKVYYQFNEDGTGATWTSYSPDFKAEFTYTYNGSTLTVTLDDGNTESLNIKLHGDYFTVSYEDEYMDFYKID